MHHGFVKVITLHRSSIFDFQDMYSIIFLGKVNSNSLNVNILSVNGSSVTEEKQYVMYVVTWKRDQAVNGIFNITCGQMQCIRQGGVATIKKLGAAPPLRAI